MFLPRLRQWLGVELVEVSVIEKLVSLVGGGMAVLILAALSFAALPNEGGVAIVASMGASAVLLFGVPHGPLSQPWPVLAGHTFSALIGVTCARMIPHPWVAAACAVGLAIAAMHQLKCIHPPGGATALAAVMGGNEVLRLGFSYVLFPVLANAVIMVVLAILLNYPFPWRRYPAGMFGPSKPQAPRPFPAEQPPTHEEVLAAVRSLDTFVDIREEDLIQLVEILAHHPSAKSELPSPTSQGNRP